MATGIIKKWMPDKGRTGIGYITPDDGSQEVKFYGDNLKGSSAANLKAGIRVEYELRRTASEPTTWSFSIIGAESEPQNQATHSTLPRGYRFLNPYNFVRYLPEPDIGSDAPVESQLIGRCPPPPHDRWVGLSGEIRCRMETITPLFVSDSEGVEQDNKKHRSHYFFNINGQKAIPASSLRGVIRSTYEAVTNSCFATFDGERFDLREGKLPDGLVPARVVEIDEKGAKLELLDCSMRLAQGIRLHRRRNGRLIPLMNAASVKVYEEQVLDTQTNTSFDPSLSRIPKGLSDGDRVAALISLRPVNNGVYQYFEAVKVVPLKAHDSLRISSGTRKVFGYLHITGPNIEKKHSERVFFRWDDQIPEKPNWDMIPKTIQVSVSSATIKECNHHFKQYWERNGRFVEGLDKKGKPWPITANDLPHPSYFIRKDRKLEKGDLVYYIPNSKLDIPVLRPILISRLPYKYDRADLLPDHIKHCSNYDSLCPACRLFGWVHGSGEEGAYGGRLSFTHAVLEKDGQPEESMRLAILSSPKPTTTYFYLIDKNGKPEDGRLEADAGYNNKNNRLRGRKFYRHFVPKREDITITSEQQEKSKNWEQNRTILDPEGNGAEFAFSIKFENLSEIELGALLWALTLDGKACHKLGYGKPLGLGSVKITIENVTLYHMIERYLSIQSTVSKSLAAWPKLVDRFKQVAANTWRRKTFENLEPVADVMALLNTSPSDLPVHYPRSPEADSKGQFEWFMGNKKELQLALRIATEDTGLPLIKKDGSTLTD